MLIEQNMEINLLIKMKINPEVLESIKYIFGEDYISNETSYITYSMFRECMTILRNVGRATAAEFIN